jgi:phosphoribosylaminoimidazolecarboxamide formyltransferase/IMP cyclohydrolase
VHSHALPPPRSALTLFTPSSHASPPAAQPLTNAEKAAFLNESLKETCLASDAFFPFRDNIDVASRFGVKYLVHPGGSVQDELVNKAADEYGMVMAHSGIRLFHH